MKTYSYTRKAQFTENIENYIGVKSDSGVYVDIYNPIAIMDDGKAHVMTGICHTNAENVKEITPIKGVQC